MVENIRSIELKGLISTLQKLERFEKLFVMQFLVSDLAQKEEQLLMPNLKYPVWSPHFAKEASATLLKLLEDDAQKK